MFCQVERAYIEDGFNLYGLRACVSNYSDCLDLILDRIGPDDSDDSHLTQNACTLYGLIHARYIVTTHGLDSMYNKVSRRLLLPMMMCHLLSPILRRKCTHYFLLIIIIIIIIISFRSIRYIFHKYTLSSTQLKNSEHVPWSNAAANQSCQWACATK